MKRKMMLSMVAVLGLTLLLSTGAFAFTSIDYASAAPDGLITFADGNFTFTHVLAGADFSIIHSLNFDTLHDFQGTIEGTYAIGTIVLGGAGYFAPVTLVSAAGTNVFTIDDGATDFTATINFADITTTTNGTFGGINLFAVANLTDFSYTGSNVELLALLADGVGTTTVSWQFSQLTAKTLYDLLAATTASPIETSYSGSISSVPVPPAVWLFGSGLLGLAGLRRRKFLKV